MRNASARFDIEALRAFAVGSVLLFHGGLPLVGSGFIGVDVFFVISGYLIVGALHREYLATGSVRLAAFWGRRARRLLPATAVVVAASAVLAWLIAGQLVQREISRDLLGATFYVANLRVAYTGSDYWSADYVSPALHFWSLGVEEQFYIATPLLIALVALLTRGRRASRRLTVALLSAVGLASAAWCWWSATAQPIWAYYSPATRAWEFVAGGLMSVLAVGREGRSRLAVWPVRLVLWSVLVVSALVLDPQSGWPGWPTAVPVGATALLLWLGRSSATVEEAAEAPWRRTVAWLGGISYSAYLWHWPLLWAAATYLRLPTPEDLPAIAALPVLALSLLLADLTRFYVEDPIRFAPGLAKSAARSLTVGLAATATGALAVGGVALLPAISVLPAPGITVPTESGSPTSTASEQQWLDELIAATVPAVDRTATLDSALPKLTDLRDDKTQLMALHCNTYMYEQEPSKRCTLGDEAGTRSVMLFGDSHAASMFGGLDLAAKSLGIKLLTRTRDQCPVADITVLQSDANRPYFECNEFRQSIIDEAIATKPDLVIIVTMLPKKVLDGDGNLVSPAEARKLFRAGYEKTVKALTDGGVKVLSVRDLPYWRFDVPDCLATYGASGCAEPVAAITPPTANDIDISNRITGAAGIDLTRAICDDAVCYPVRAGAIVVRDDVHLTETYSRKLADLWTGILRHYLDL